MDGWTGEGFNSAGDVFTEGKVAESVVQPKLWLFRPCTEIQIQFPMVKYKYSPSKRCCVTFDNAPHATGKNTI